ncbi:hypothetical protein [Roseibium sp.]|uniref:hypothetical protein n=1 Tax=Roseibium sp. TaxID=1936156 RepID=UPI003D0A845E
MLGHGQLLTGLSAKMNLKFASNPVPHKNLATFTGAMVPQEVCLPFNKSADKLCTAEIRF